MLTSDVRDRIQDLEAVKGDMVVEGVDQGGVALVEEEEVEVVGEEEEGEVNFVLG